MAKFDKKRQTGAGVSFTPAALAERIAGAGFAPGEAELPRLFTYLEMLQKWNKVMNLVGPYSWPELVDNLILDSFHLADFLAAIPLPEAPECWDFGAGAGLPGIPLRILWNKGSYTMVDSREKRVLFLHNVLAQLQLPRTQAVAARVENFMQGAVPANLLISRAFMPWQQLLELVKGKLAFDDTMGKAPGIALFMTLEAPPASLPSGWRLVADKCYLVPQGLRYFWALSASGVD